MALLSGTRQLIEARVANRVTQDTIFGQLARFVNLQHTQADNGECSATITVRVSLHALDGERLGPELNGPGIASYTRELVADNNTIVDAATGAILRIRTTEDAAEWPAAGEAYAQAVMLQGDFFEMLRRYSPIDIEEMIVQHIQQADAMGRFA